MKMTRFVCLKFFFRATSIRECPTFRLAPLFRIAPSFVKTREFLQRSRVASRFANDRRNSVLYFFHERRDNVYAALFSRHFISAPDDWNFFTSRALFAKRFSTVERASKSRARLCLHITSFLPALWPPT